MAFVRTKKVKNEEYYQLVESRRVEGKPRQKVLVHLGKHPTVNEALKEWPREIERLRRLAREERDRVPEGRERTPADRNSLKRADSADKRADALETSLKKLRDFRKKAWRSA